MDLVEMGDIRKADMWSVGCLLVEMVVDRNIFQGWWLDLYCYLYAILYNNIEKTCFTTNFTQPSTPLRPRGT